MQKREVFQKNGKKLCYKDLPINISGEIMFLDLTTRNVGPIGKPRRCDQPPPIILAKDATNKGYKLDSKGAWTEIKMMSKSIHEEVKIPKIHEYSEGDELPKVLYSRGGSGLARAWGHVKICI